MEPWMLPMLGAYSFHPLKGWPWLNEWERGNVAMTSHYLPETQQTLYCYPEATLPTFCLDDGPTLHPGCPYARSRRTFRILCYILTFPVSPAAGRHHAIQLWQRKHEEAFWGSFWFPGEGNRQEDRAEWLGPLIPSWSLDQLETSWADKEATQHEKKAEEDRGKRQETSPRWHGWAASLRVSC